jgi:hypothetical protein
MDSDKRQGARDKAEGTQQKEEGTTDPIDEKLPVTAELGSEGGSYGDGALQAETLRGASGNPRVDPKRVAPLGGEAAAAAAEGEQVRDSADEVKHATESPERSQRGRRRDG